ncbi:MAG TPA: 2Fe-2S iron-sulfur cluster-binding protein [Nevskiaceae bacterium]|nr:2Fe-2S iron-sulfur cluster-binding protein [Nevskiaceae bacterium]
MSHRVTLADRSTGFDAEPQENLLAAGLRQRLALPFGCRSGTCASCRVRLLSGQVEYPVAPPALSAAEIDAGYILMCLAQPRSDLSIELHQPPQLDAIRPRTLPCRVQQQRMLAHDVIGLILKLPKSNDSSSAFRFLPGQYIDFLLDGGRRRSFSIANAPAPDLSGEVLELHLRVTPQGRFARWVLEEMPARAILQFEGPLGAFYVREDSARPLLFVAGGTGFAPIKAMIERQLALGSARPMHLYWGARSRRDLYLHDLAAEWAAQHARLRYTPVLSEPDEGWTGERGMVHEAVLRAQPDLRGYEAYLSGPPVMVRTGKLAFAAAGLDSDHLYYDSFDYAYETWPVAG